MANSLPSCAAVATVAPSGEAARSTTLPSMPSASSSTGPGSPPVARICSASTPGPSVTHTARPEPSTRGSLARESGSTCSARAGPSLCVSQCTVPRTSTTLACPV
jgi:hypothetical protein